MLRVGHDKGSVDRAEVMRWILNRNGLLLIVARFDIFHCLLWCSFSRPLLTQSGTICLPIACAISSQKFKFFLFTQGRFLRAICRDFEREYFIRGLLTDSMIKARLCLPRVFACMNNRIAKPA